MSKFRYVAISPGRADGKHVEAMGKAVFLHDFLIDHQTDEFGRVHYGKLITYAWIRERFKNAPPPSTIRKWMARLRDAGYLECIAVNSQHGMRIRILNQKKWPGKPIQPSLFESQELAFTGCGKVSEKAVEKPKVLGVTLRPKMDGPSAPEWTPYSYKEEKNEETIKSAVQTIARAHSVENPTMTPSQIEKRKAFLREQAKQLEKKFKTPG